LPIGRAGAIAVLVERHHHQMFDGRVGMLAAAVQEDDHALAFE